MNTPEQAISMVRRRRRRHSEAFKADAVAACLQPGVSIAAVALSRGLNANLLRRWVIEAERTGAPTASSASALPETARGFVPVSLTSTVSEAVIRLELRCGAGAVSVQWPASAARECAALLRELMR